MNKNGIKKSSKLISENSIQNDKDKTQRDKDNDLENITESDLEEEIIYNLSQKEEIKNIKQKIFPLESKISNLQKNFREFIKENKNNIRRNTFIGLRANFVIENNNDIFQIPQLIKEKYDLQEANEKLENILKQKSKEISELNMKLNNTINNKKEEEENHKSKIEEL